MVGIPTWKANSTVVSGTASVTPSTPGGLDSDDICIYAIITAAQAPGNNPPSGFTECPSSPQSVGSAGGTSSVRLSLFYRFGTGTIPATGDSGDHQFAFVQVYNGVDPTNPFNFTAGDVEPSATTAVTIPSGTTDIDNCYVLNYCAHALDSAAAEFSSIADDLGATATHLNEGTTQGNGSGLLINGGTKAVKATIAPTTAVLGTASVQARITLALNPIHKKSTVTAAAETYAGQPVASNAKHNVAVAAGSEAYAGQTVTTRYTFRSMVTAGAQAYAGQAIITNAKRVVSVIAGSLTYTGQAIASSGSTISTVAAGALTYAGQTLSTVSSAVAAAGGFVRSMWMGLRL